MICSEDTQTSLRYVQTGSWQVVLCPAGLHFITTAALVHAVFVHSQRTSQRLSCEGLELDIMGLWQLLKFRVM